MSGVILKTSDIPYEVMSGVIHWKHL